MHFLDYERSPMIKPLEELELRRGGVVFFAMWQEERKIFNNSIYN